MILWILGALASVLFLFVLLSPLESLRWWADKGEKEVRQSFETLPEEHRAGTEKRRFVVYLSGVGVVGGDQLSRREIAWLETLQEGAEDVVVVADVFPYAVDNRGLLQRATERIWSYLDRARRSGKINPLPLLINLRNIAQVLVSSDPRYGPTYNVGLAQEIWRSLQRHGYVPGSGDPVIMIGFSGGAQMALGAGWFLAGVGVPVSLVSVGGIFSDDPGLDRMTHIWQLSGSKDKLQFLGPIVFPGRWPTAPLSPWGRAKREGRVTLIDMGPMRHDGGDAYFGRSRTLPDGRTHAQATLDVVLDIIEREPKGLSTLKRCDQ